MKKSNASSKVGVYSTSFHNYYIRELRWHKLEVVQVVSPRKPPDADRLREVSERMSKYVAFMRAINVPGHLCVRMSDLKDAFTAAGSKDARTFIQSGNVIFDGPGKNIASISQEIRSRLCHLLGAEPSIFFRTIRELEGVLTGAPFKRLEGEPGLKLYVAFLSQKPRSKPAFPLLCPKEELEVVAIKEREVFIVSRRKKNGFYGFPNNFIEKELGVSATSRNWSTLTKMVELVRKESGV